MQKPTEKVQENQIDLIDVLGNIRLINVSEIKIIQEVLGFIDTHYAEHKSMIPIATVVALILNRDDIPNLYATSKRGHNNQVLEFQNQFGINGFKVKNKLVPWALDKITQGGLPQNLNQDLNTAFNSSRNVTRIDGENLLELLATIDLINVTEFLVIKEAVSYINSNYPESARKINLSDVCALALNHDDVNSLYATSEEEYNEFKDTFITKYQPQVNKVVHQMVDKISEEGSKYLFSHDSLVKVNFQRHKKLTKAWNI